MVLDVVDTRKIATDVAQRAIDRIIIIGEKIIKDYLARYKNRDVSTYAEYLVRKGVQADTVRNFMSDSKSASLYDIYVPTMISDGEWTGDELIRQLCDPVVTPKKRPTRAFVIVGKAGAGKSLFMKHAFFKIQRLDSKHIPIFIEVRSFNRVPLDTLETRIYEEFAATGITISREQVANGLRSGLFAILLDGMDELKGVIQAHYETELRDLVVKFPLCPILVTSRPTEKLVSWGLDLRSIAPLSLSAAEDLIARLDFDEALKAAFATLLRKSLFKTHYDLVSLPLLCTIMLLTFSNSGRIAHDRHEFYEDAFVALWSKHDSRKGDFERHRYTGLQKNDFLRLLSAFAVSSYTSADYEMRPTQFRRHFSIAVRLSGVMCKEEDFQQDLVISTSIAIVDGPYIRFCHRSFQEYFAAVFLAETDDSTVSDLIEELSDRLETDYVLHLLLSMNDEKIEKCWVLPRSLEIVTAIKMVGNEIQLYAALAVGDTSASSNVAVAMHKIRLLYGLEPTTGMLRSAYDAAQHMRITVKRLVKGATVKGRVFTQDRNNFIRLNGNLDTRYRRRSSALQELLGQRDPDFPQMTKA